MTQSNINKWRSATPPSGMVLFSCLWPCGPYLPLVWSEVLPAQRHTLKRSVKLTLVRRLATPPRGDGQQAGCRPKPPLTGWRFKACQTAHCIQIVGEREWRREGGQWHDWPKAVYLVSSPIDFLLAGCKRFCESWGVIWRIMEPGRAEGVKPRAGNLRSLPSGRWGVDSFGKTHFKLR